MPNICTAYGCSNTSAKASCKEKNISFHHFPFNDKPRLKQWLIKMKRKNFKPTVNSRLCSEHFLSSDFEYQPFTNRRLLKNTAIPTIFSFTEANTPVRPRTSYVFGSGNVHNDDASETESLMLPFKEEKSTQTEDSLVSHLLAEIKKLKSENDDLKTEIKKSHFSPDNLEDSEMIVFTGFSKIQFEAIYLFLKDVEKQKLFIFFMRLKSGMTENMMSFFFKISQSTISRTINLLTELIYSKISSVGIWPEKNKVFENMPYVFKHNFPQCRVIVDCTEFSIQKPSNPKEQQLTFSSYKNTNTVKCLIGIAPSGGISFVSEAWGGNVSDKELFLKSGIMDLLEPGDVILADRGFTIKKEVEAKGCKVYTPAFLKDKIQFNIIERKQNKKISRHRVHVERAILRIKQFKFFNGQISYNSLHSISKLIYITAFFTNFGNSLINC